jgi:NADH:ubiquinone oxidoreductase subunit C
MTVGWLPAPVEELFGPEATAEASYEVLTVDVPPASWTAALDAARSTLGCAYFDWLSAVDEPGTGIRVLAHVVALSPVRRLLVRTTVPHSAPVLPSAVSVYAGAAWHERETHEMFGVTFEGHPGLDPLLLPEGFEGHPLRKDFVLAARVAKAWPGAKEPGESEHGGPKRRQMLPPGVPDPNEWGPLKGQLPAAPARPARGAARAAGDRPVRRARTAGEGSASQAPGGRGVGAGAVSDTPAGAPASSPAGTPSGSPSGSPAGAPAGSPSGSQAGAPAGTEAPAPPRRARSASQGSATQRAEGTAPTGAEGTAPTAPAEPTAPAAPSTPAEPTAPAAPARPAAPRSSDAPWHHARPAFDEPGTEPGPGPKSEAEPEPRVEAASEPAVTPEAGTASAPEDAPKPGDAPKPEDVPKREVAPKREAGAKPPAATDSDRDVDDNPGVDDTPEADDTPDADDTLDAGPTPAPKPSHDDSRGGTQ